jgi:EpsI family protein
MNNKTFLIVAVILAGFAVLALSTYLPHIYDASKEPQMVQFPLKIGEWQGKDVPISENDYAILATKNLIMREYDAQDKQPVVLYIVYSGDNRKSLHPPEICYTGSGGTILEKSIVPLTVGLKANKFTIEERHLKQLVVYWFRADNLNTPSYIKQQIRTALYRTFGKQASGAMIRMSTVVKHGEDAQALQTIKGFARLIEPLLSKYVP